MKNSNRIVFSAVTLILALVLCAGCYYAAGTLGETGDEGGETPAERISENTDADGEAAASGNTEADSETPDTSGDAEYTAAPATAVTEKEPASGATITFSGSRVTVTGNSAGVKIEGTAVTVSEPGTYTVTGTSAEGSVKVKKGVTGVTLVLRDLSLASSTTAPVAVGKESSAAIFVSGTVTLTDNENEINDTGAEDSTFEGAAIKLKSGASLTLGGSGSLTIAANCKNGIKGAAQSSLTVTGGVTLSITAASNGIAADGSVTVERGSITVTAGNDGIKSEPDEGDTASQGTVTVTGGAITVKSGGDGIHAVNELLISGGTVDITAFGGYQNVRSLGTDSAKGLKSDTLVTVTGGTLTVNSADDAVHSNVTVTVTGGTFTIYTGDDAFHADDTVNIGTAGSETGPDITVEASYEGVEAATVNLMSGRAVINADDDGTNGADGTSSSYGFGGRGGGSSAVTINISGGWWYINAGGDGIDANGNINISGGTIISFGSAGSMNPAFDYDGTATLTGGELLAVGNSGMAQAPNALSLWFSASIQSGSKAEIRDASGSVVISFTGVKNANTVIYSSTQLTSGASYSLYVNGTKTATATAGVNPGNPMGGGGRQNPGGGGGGRQNPGGSGTRP